MSLHICFNRLFCLNLVAYLIDSCSLISCFWINAVVSVSNYLSLFCSLFCICLNHVFHVICFICLASTCSICFLQLCLSLLIYLVIDLFHVVRSLFLLFFIPSIALLSSLLYVFLSFFLACAFLALLKSSFCLSFFLSFFLSLFLPFLLSFRVFSFLSFLFFSFFFLSAYFLSFLIFLL